MAGSSITRDAFAEKLLECSRDKRIIVAIAGPPGAGKSTLANDLCNILNDQDEDICSVLSMDGFHYDDAYLNQQGWCDRKGAPHTFDVGGFKNLLERLRINQEGNIAIPIFDRELEISHASAAIIQKSSKIILVEGNYLLLKQEPWASLGQYFDLSLMLKVNEETLYKRLSKRWLDFGFSQSDTDNKLSKNDLINVNVVIENSSDADYTINMEN